MSYKNLILKLLKETVLSERKQVGLLYHFTSFQSLVKIINSNFRLTSSIQPYVSFTRNKRMMSNTISSDIRITVNGDRLTDKYKITPYSDVKAGYGRSTSDESEERINLKNYPSGVDISSLLINIELKNPLTNTNDFDDEESFGPSMLGEFQKVIKLLKAKNIQYTVVNSFN